ncbi:MAG: hypothetical protein ACI9ES_003212 [Oceanospirillaceae bacterium]|jgi:hypothetical protein
MKYLASLTELFCGHEYQQDHYRLGNSSFKIIEIFYSKHNRLASL